MEGLRVEALKRGREVSTGGEMKAFTESVDHLSGNGGNLDTCK